MCRHEKRSAIALGAVATAQEAITRARRFLKSGDSDSADQVLREGYEALQEATREASESGGVCDPSGSRLRVTIDAEAVARATEAGAGVYLSADRLREASKPEPKYAAEVEEAREKRGHVLCPDCGSPNVHKVEGEFGFCRSCFYGQEKDAPELPEGVVAGRVL